MIQPMRTGRPALTVKVEHFGLGFLVLQLHLVPANFDDLALGGIGGVARDYEETNQRSLLATDLFDHFVELHVDNVLELRLSLGDRGDSIVDRQTSITIGRPAQEQLPSLWHSRPPKKGRLPRLPARASSRFGSSRDRMG